MDASVVHSRYVVAKDYYMNLFTAILSHDRINNGQLMQTLRTYMACNAKLAATAKTLYIHENTLKYRLNKIESLLNMNIHELNTQFRLKIGFMIGDLLGLGEGYDAKKGTPFRLRAPRSPLHGCGENWLFLNDTCNKMYGDARNACRARIGFPPG